MSRKKKPSKTARKLQEQRERIAGQAERIAKTPSGCAQASALLALAARLRRKP